MTAAVHTARLLYITSDYSNWQAKGSILCQNFQEKLFKRRIETSLYQLYSLCLYKRLRFNGDRESFKYE